MCGHTPAPNIVVLQFENGASRRFCVLVRVRGCAADRGRERDNRCRVDDRLAQGAGGGEEGMKVATGTLPAGMREAVVAWKRVRYQLHPLAQN